MTINTTFFRPRFDCGALIRVTGAEGTMFVQVYGPDEPGPLTHREAAEQYLVAYHVAADLGTAHPMPSGNGYTFDTAGA